MASPLQGPAHLVQQIAGGRFAELAGGPADAKPLAAEFRDDVEVHVHHHLMGRRAVVLEHVVGGGARRLHHGAAEARQHAADGGGRLVRKLVELGLALLGDDQGVAFRERADVEEGEDVVVLVHLVARDLPREDLVENGGLVVAHEAVFYRPWTANPDGTRPTAATSSISAASSCRSARSRSRPCWT